MAQFILPECSIDSECPGFGVYFCIDVHCIDGTCVNSSYECAPDTPVCDETNDQCVECIDDSDCYLMSLEESLIQTSIMRENLQANTSLIPLTSRYCDIGSLFELTETNSYDLTYLYGIIPVNITVQVTMRCNSQTYTCYNSSNITNLDFVYVNQSVNSNVTTSIDVNSCSFNTQAPICDEQNERCSQCMTTNDCLYMMEQTLGTAFPSEIEKLSDFCLPSIYCHIQSGSCLLAKAPVESPQNTVINTINKLNFINLTDIDSGVVFSVEQLTDLISQSDNVTHFFDLLTTWNSDIQQTPCDFIDQRNRNDGTSILYCNTIPGLCSAVQCQSSVDCQDDNECNGEETCDIQTLLCVFPENSTCPSGKMCDIGSDLCQECLNDTQCEPENPCDGIGICIPDTENNGRMKCDIIERCNSIIETCDPFVNITEVLSWYAYTSTEMPQIPSDRHLQIGPDDDTYDIPPVGNSSTIDGTNQSTVGNQRKSISTDLSVSSIQENSTNTDLLPPNFDWRRIYCKSYYCENATECPIGTICKIYTTNTNINRKCKKCTTDAECQDGIKCNGQERCHPEGTCRRSKRNVCEQYILDNNQTLTLDNVTCIEKSGLCILKDGNNTNSSDLLVLSHNNKITTQNLVNIMVDNTTTPAQPISTTILATAIVIPLTAVIVVIIIIVYWLSSYQRKIKRKKKGRNKKKSH